MDTAELRKVAESYGLNLIEVDDSYLDQIDSDWSFFEECSHIAHPDIQLGRYDDEERRVSSVFHEIGHCVAGKEGISQIDSGGPDFKVPGELIAWLVGFREASKHGIHFSSGTIQWAIEQALTYRGYK
jgi:hypothetical protein